MFVRAFAFCIHVCIMYCCVVNSALRQLEFVSTKVTCKTQICASMLCNGIVCRVYDMFFSCQSLQSLYDGSICFHVWEGQAKQSVWAKGKSLDIN